MELPSARARLAALRGAVDETPGENAEVWQLVLESIPERFVGTRDEPTAGEWAAHLALTLYAVHQRGNSRPVHVSTEQRSFGSAVGALMAGRTDSTKRIYDALISATNFETRRHYLRSLIGLMSTDSRENDRLGFDYGRFALDLYRLQFAEYRPALLRNWGRDFYRSFVRTESSTSEATNISS